MTHDTDALVSEQALANLKKELSNQIDTHKSNIEYRVRLAAEAQAAKDYEEMHAHNDRADIDRWHMERYQKAADAIARLTRELGEARAAEKSANGWYAKLERECQEVRRELKQAEAERDAARAELEELKQKIDQLANPDSQKWACERW